MPDIIEMLCRRQEEALELLKERYGPYCRRILWNLLQEEGPVEEAANDLWLHVWNSIPPGQPKDWRLYLGRAARNIAIDHLRRENAARRGGGAILMGELSECLPDEGWEDRMEARELRELLEQFIRGLKDEERRVFLLRYYRGETIPVIASTQKCSVSRVTSMLHRLRKRLKQHLEQEGYRI